MKTFISYTFSINNSSMGFGNVIIEKLPFDFFQTLDSDELKGLEQSIIDEKFPDDKENINLTILNWKII